MLVVELAASMGWRTVIIEGDCLEVIQKLQVEVEDLSSIGHIIHNVRNKRKMLADCHFAYVRRFGNRVVHQVARNAVLNEIGTSQFSFFVNDAIIFYLF
ncbi:hypothetical protein Pfo_005199 [Paulownia fortunei]|nr:hypothetical protein Pfo_005199 [Paulownia fortunei]